MYTVAVLIHTSSQQHFLFPYIYASVYCNLVSSYFSHFNLSKMKSQVTLFFFPFFNLKINFLFYVPTPVLPSFPSPIPTSPYPTPYSLLTGSKTPPLGETECLAYKFR